MQARLAEAPSGPRRRVLVVAPMRTIGTLAAAVLLAGVAAAHEDAPPRKKAALRAWLASGAYRTAYTPEPAAHLSAGPHGMEDVRTWYSPTLVDDLRAGRTVFGKGAAMVKEIYTGDIIVGWATMRKLKRKSGPTGKGWLFYEAVSGSSFFGRGQPLCAGCHVQGTDYLRSEFRP